MRQNKMCDNAPIDADSEKRILDAIAEFIAGVGHELNNPLAVISGIAQSLLHEETDMDKRRDLSMIVEQTRQAYEMIASIRAFARPPEPEVRAISAREFFDDWIGREKSRLEPLNVDVVVEGADCLNDVVLMSDPAMFSAILDAFGKNVFDVVKYERLQRSLCESLPEQEKSVDVAIFFAALSERDVRRLTFGVEDNGPGMSPEVRKLAFSPFYSGRHAGRGLGVGLSTAWRYAEILGARIFCEDANSFDSGCRWSVEFPIR